MPPTSHDPARNWTLEDRGDYLYVHLMGTLATAAAVRRYQLDIERAMSPGIGRKVIFDNRDATPSPEELRAGMWTWLSTTPAIGRAAVVAHTARIQRRVRQTAEDNRLRVASFPSVEEAEAWLRGGQ